MNRLKNARRKLAVETLERRALLAADWQAFSFPDNEQYGIYLKLDSIPGEATASGYEDSIELESFSWGANTERGVVSPTANTVQELVALTDVSGVSPLLLDAFATGRSLSSAQLVVARDVQNRLETIYQVDLKDVTLASLQTRSLNGEIPQEQFSLRFSSLNESVWSLDSANERDTKFSRELKAPRGVIWQSPSDYLDDTHGERDQVDAILELTGIPGQAGGAARSISIDVESFSWGMSQTSTATVGANSWGSSGRQFAVQDFHFAAPVSAATTELINGVNLGYTLPSATLRIKKADDASEYLTYKLSDVLISSYQMKSLGEVLPTEEFTLNFSKLSEAFVPTQPVPMVTGRWQPPPASIYYVSGESLLSDTAASAPGIAGTYIKLDGVTGESTLAGYQGAVEATSFSWGVSRPVSSRTSNGRAISENLELQDLRFVADVSKASPVLLQNLSTARRSPNVTLNSVLISQNDAPVSLLKLELSDVLVSSLHQQGLNGSTPVEEAGLNFQKIRVTQSSFQEDGSLTSRTTNLSNLSGGKLATYSPGSSILHESPATGSESRTYLKLDGITGSSLEQGFEGAIEVDSFSWGLRRTDLDSQAGRNGSSPRFVADAFEVVSDFDSSTVPLYMAALNRNGFPTATLATVRESDDDGLSPPAPYLTYKLQDVLVTGFQARGEESSIPQQLASLSFMKIRETVTREAPISSTAVGEWSVGKFEVGFSASSDLLEVTPARAANTAAFIKLSNVRGDSYAEGHNGETEVLSFSFGASQSNHARKLGGAASSSDVWVQDLHVVTAAGYATTDLARAAVDGKIASQGVLSLTRFHDFESEDYLKIKLTDVVFSSYSTRGESGFTPLEEVALNFAKIQFEQNGTTTTFDWATAPAPSWGTRTGGVKSEVGSSLIEKTRAPEDDLAIYLKFEGLDANFAPLHASAIDIDSFSWGLTRTVTRTRRGIGVGRPEFTDLSLSASLSTASPALIGVLLDGKQIPQATLVVHHPTYDNQAPGDFFLKYELRNLTIPSHGSTRLPGSFRDDFGLRFGRIAVTANTIPRNSA